MKKYISCIIGLGLLLNLRLLAQTLPFGQVAYCDDFNAATFQHTTVGWDWRDDTPANWRAYIKTKPTVNPQTFSQIDLPFPVRPQGGNQYPNVLHLNVNTAFDHEPADGWEMVYKVFGTGPSLAQAIENPTLVLYNRFRGILRIFIFLTVDQTNLITESGVDLHFDITKKIASSLFGFMESPSHSVEGFDSGRMSFTVNSYSNTVGGEWLFADIPVAYDPCTCGFSQNPNDPSTLRPNVGEIIVGGALVSTSTWTNTDATGATKPIYNNDYGSSTSAISVIEKGTKYFKSIPALTDAINAQKTKTSVVPQADVTYNIKTTKPIKLPTWIKVLPYVEDVFLVLDALITGGEAGDKNSTANTATPTEVTFSGGLSTIASTLPTAFYTPGSPHNDPSFTNPDAVKIPIYDYVLGIFNLIEKPVLEYTTYQPYDVSPDSYTCSNILGQTEQGMYLPPIHQYRLKSPLRYVVNPASELELIGLDYAIQYQLGSNQAGVAVSTDHVIQSPGLGIQLGLYGPVAGLQPTLGSKYAQMTYQQRLRAYGLDIAFWPSTSPNSNVGVSDIGKITYTTEFVPAQCSDKVSVFLAIPDANTPYFSQYAYTPELQLKVRAIFRRTDADATESTEDVVFMATYKLETESVSGGISYFINAYNGNLASCSNQNRSLYMRDYRVTSFTSTQGSTALFPLGSNGIPYDLVLENQTISTSQYAMNSITLNNVQYFSPSTSYTPPYPGAYPIITPGPPIEIKAGRSINVVPGSGSSMGDYNVNLELGLPTTRFNGCDAGPLQAPATYSQIQQVCTDINRYNPAVSNRYGNSSGSNSETIPFTAAPNPFTGEITLRFSLPEADRVSLTVLDLTGRTVAVIWQDRAQEAGAVEVPWTGSELAPGIYIAVLETSRGRETVRIVKQ